jgi:hypothetical protein
MADSLPDLALLGPKSPSETRLNLLDLEHWVSNSLDSWLVQNAKSKRHLVALSKVIDEYMATSIPTYATSPEDFSVMILTLMLLWTALDKATANLYPLLKKFDPGFPTTLFEPLLIPKRHQMVGLRDVEKYLADRKTSCIPGNPSIFEVRLLGNSLFAILARFGRLHAESA